MFDGVRLLTVELVARARKFAAEAYGAEGELEHPNEVAELVAGSAEELQAAAILHDLVEDTDVTIPDIAARFGSRVAALVAALTEDDSIGKYKPRKQEHRQRASEAGRDVALLFVADKLSNARRMHRGQKKLDPKKVGHYRATLETMRAAYPDLPLLSELEEAIAAIEPATQSGGPAAQPRARA